MPVNSSLVYGTPTRHNRRSSASVPPFSLHVSLYLPLVCLYFCLSVRVCVLPACLEQFRSAVCLPIGPLTSSGRFGEKSAAASQQWKQNYHNLRKSRKQQKTAKSMSIVNHQRCREQTWTWVGSIHGLGSVGLDWVGLGPKILTFQCKTCLKLINLSTSILRD